MTAWWALWIGGSLLTNVSTQLYLRSDTMEGLLLAAQLNAASQVLLIAAVPLAYLVVRELTRSFDLPLGD